MLNDLRRALVLAIVDGNESPLLAPDERDPNAGHWAMSSENARVAAHGINYDDENGWTGNVSGSRARQLNIGIPLEPIEGLDPVRFPYPADLRLPTMTRRLDVEYADAAWESMRRGTDAARRLSRAIDWLGLAWLNPMELTDDLRIPALHAGLEVLYGTEDTVAIACAVAQDTRDTTPAVKRSATHPKTGKQKYYLASDVEWWSIRFSFLRNALMHGWETQREDWMHDGKPHTDLACGRLTQAIKQAVIVDGHEDIQDDVLFRKAAREFRKRLAASTAIGEEPVGETTEADN